MWERAGLMRNDPDVRPGGGREGENMKIIRIAGGVGSGKSQVLSILKEEYNAHVILADEVAKRLMEPGQPVFARWWRRWGTDSGSGRDDRPSADGTDHFLRP